MEKREAGPTRHSPPITIYKKFIFHIVTR